MKFEDLVKVLRHYFFNIEEKEVRENQAFQCLRQMCISQEIQMYYDFSRQEDIAAFIDKFGIEAYEKYKECKFMTEDYDEDDNDIPVVMDNSYECLIDDDETMVYNLTTDILEHPNTYKNIINFEKLSESFLSVLADELNGSDDEDE